MSGEGYQVHGRDNLMGGWLSDQVLAVFIPRTHEELGL